MSLYCHFVENRLPLFVGGDLSMRATRRVRGHLQRCGSCHALYQSYRRSYVALHRMGDAQEPEALAEDFWPELEDRLRSDRRGRGGWIARFRFDTVRRVGVAASVLIAFGVGFFLGDVRFGGRTPSPRPFDRGESLSHLGPVLGPSEYATPVYWDDVEHDVPRRAESFHYRQKLPFGGYRTVEPQYQPLILPTSGGEFH